MEYLNDDCFALLTSFLYLNEVQALRLVSVRLLTRLDDEYTGNLVVRASRALVFPGNWTAAPVEERESTGFCSRKFRTTGCRGISPLSPAQDSPSNDAPRHPLVPPGRSAIAARGAGATYGAEDHFQSVSGGDRTIPPNEDRATLAGPRPRQGRATNGRRVSLVGRLLRFTPSCVHLQHLSLYWSSTAPAPQNTARLFRQLLFITCSSLKSLLLVGCPPSEYTCRIPTLRSTFSCLKVLRVCSSSGSPGAGYPHLLTWCRFPVCEELEWVDPSFIAEPPGPLAVVMTMRHLVKLSVVVDTPQTLNSVLHLVARCPGARGRRSAPGQERNQLKYLRVTPCCEHLFRRLIAPPRSASSADSASDLTALPGVKEVCFAGMKSAARNGLDELVILARRIAPLAQKISFEGRVSLQNTAGSSRGIRPEDSHQFIIRSQTGPHNASHAGSTAVLFETLRSPEWSELSIIYRGPGALPSFEIGRSKEHAISVARYEQFGLLRGGRTETDTGGHMGLIAVPTVTVKHTAEDFVAACILAAVRSLPAIVLSLEPMGTSFVHPLLFQPFDNLIGMQVFLSRSKRLHFHTDDWVRVARTHASRTRLLRVVCSDSLGSDRTSDVCSQWGAGEASHGGVYRDLELLLECCNCVEMIEFRCFRNQSWEGEIGVVDVVPCFWDELTRDFQLRARYEAPCLNANFFSKSSQKRIAGYSTFLYYVRKHV
ncbi:hypothetical protein CSUI_005525 [Cystoisospora suis]|uniref:Uncharacterized protein n=1 Tax=Cystoisospora suis TaxID=483139 RepID=A0A2C6KX67_9APIC|nr:hypothetical protein CSUI_005525 [Cystoisospora suis]